MPTFETKGKRAPTPAALWQGPVRQGCRGQLHNGEACVGAGLVKPGCRKVYAVRHPGVWINRLYPHDGRLQPVPLHEPAGVLRSGYYEPVYGAGQDTETRRHDLWVLPDQQRGPTEPTQGRRQAEGRRHLL